MVCTQIKRTLSLAHIQDFWKPKGSMLRPFENFYILNQWGSFSSVTFDWQRRSLETSSLSLSPYARIMSKALDLSEV